MPFVLPLISLGVSRSRYKWAITGDTVALGEAVDPFVSGWRL
jgi:hypothetical protein